MMERRVGWRKGKKRLQKICMTLPTDRSFPNGELENLPATLPPRQGCAMSIQWPVQSSRLFPAAAAACPTWKHMGCY